MLTIPAEDGVPIQATDEGEGPCLLVVHPGMDDGRSWARVNSLLARRFRVVAILRRQYRPDRGQRRCSIAREAADVVALARAVGQPVAAVGHSSGGIVALEAMALAPELFAGAVVYEAPIEIAGDEFRTRVRATQVAWARGRRSRALWLFLRDIVEVPAPAALAAGALLPRIPRYRPLVPRQIDDVAAIDDLGPRLDVYARIGAPVVLLDGERSPAHLRLRTARLASTLPAAATVVLRGQGHGANQRSPEAVAGAVTDLAERVFAAQ